MSDSAGQLLAGIVSAVLVLAIVAVVVSKNAATTSLISDTGTGLASLIGMAEGTGSSVASSPQNLASGTQAAAAPFLAGSNLASAAANAANEFF